MKASEVIGAIASFIFAVSIFLSIASNSPVYNYWGENLKRLISQDLAAIGRAIGEYIWVNFFPAFIGLLMVLIVLFVGLVSLLRGE